MDREELKNKITKKSEEIKKLHTELDLLIKFSEETTRYNKIISKKRKHIDSCFRELNLMCKEYKQFTTYSKPRLFCCLY